MEFQLELWRKFSAMANVIRSIPIQVSSKEYTHKIKLCEKNISNFFLRFQSTRNCSWHISSAGLFFKFSQYKNVLQFGDNTVIARYFAAKLFDLCNWIDFDGMAETNVD